jgi:hypothetical protein
MKRLYSSLAVYIMIIFSVVSCYYDSEEALYPSIGGSCDTTNVTFSGTIKPMLSNNCYSCHSNATAASFGAGIRLENYADVKANATSVQGAVKHSSGFSPMPKNGGKLNSCLISQFDVWVGDGMPDN